MKENTGKHPQWAPRAQTQQRHVKKPSSTPIAPQKHQNGYLNSLEGNLVSMKALVVANGLFKADAENFLRGGSISILTTLRDCSYEDRKKISSSLAALKDSHNIPILKKQALIDYLLQIKNGVIKLHNLTINLNDQQQIKAQLDVLTPGTLAHQASQLKIEDDKKVTNVKLSIQASKMKQLVDLLTHIANLESNQLSAKTIEALIQTDIDKLTAERDALTSARRAIRHQAPLQPLQFLNPFKLLLVGANICRLGIATAVNYFDKKKAKSSVPAVIAKTVLSLPFTAISFLAAPLANIDIAFKWLGSTLFPKKEQKTPTAAVAAKKPGSSIFAAIRKWWFSESTLTKKINTITDKITNIRKEMTAQEKPADSGNVKMTVLLLKKLGRRALDTAFNNPTKQAVQFRNAAKDAQALITELTEKPVGKKVYQHKLFGRGLSIEKIERKNVAAPAA